MPYRIGARLRKGEPIVLREAGVHLMGHQPAADVVPERADCRLAFDLAWLARRIVAVDDAHHSVIGIKACKQARVD